MKTAFNNFCNSCTNIGCEFQSGIAWVECSYMPPQMEPDNSGNYIVTQPTPTVEVIPKEYYEARLKADMVAMLEELQLEIMELPVHVVNNMGSLIRMEIAPSAEDASELIQEKINALKRGNNEHI